MVPSRSLRRCETAKVRICEPKRRGWGRASPLPLCESAAIRTFVFSQTRKAFCCMRHDHTGLSPRIGMPKARLFAMTGR